MTVASVRQREILVIARGTASLSYYDVLSFSLDDAFCCREVVVVGRRSLLALFERIIAVFVRSLVSCLIVFAVYIYQWN